MLSCRFSSIKFSLFIDHPRKPRKLHIAKNSAYTVCLCALLKKAPHFILIFFSSRTVKNSHPYCNNTPIMQVLCLMLSGTKIVLA